VTGAAGIGVVLQHKLPDRHPGSLPRR